MSPLPAELPEEGLGTERALDLLRSGPAAITVERWVVRQVARLAGQKDGMFTADSTTSNLTALQLARDAAARQRGIDVRRDGVHALEEPTVYCSELAHLPIQRACAVLGLGENAVRPIEVDQDHRMQPEALRNALDRASTPVAVVATAGTADFGSVDPLPDLAELAGEHGAWFHVDAARGFGALFSKSLAPLLEGLRHANSVTAGLHPAAASLLLVQDGMLGTACKPDAMQVAATLLALGTEGLGELVDRCHALAHHAAGLIADDEGFELVSGVVLTTVVFRYVTAEPERSNEVNAELRRLLVKRGQDLVGRTDVGKTTCLRFTLLNPRTTATDLARLLDLVRHAGSVAEEMLRQEGVA